jgi:hypothetical protein
MPNPKGTPENLQPFSTDREEKLTEQLNIRVSEKMKEEVKKQNDPNEFVREAIKEKLEKQKSSETDI